MTNEHVFQPVSRGVQMRTPTLRVMRQPVAAARARDGANAGGWLKEAAQPDWHPVSMRWGIDGKETALTLRVVLGQSGPHVRRRPEDDHCNAGDLVRLVQVGSHPLGGRNSQLEWFRGVIASQELLIGAEPDVESFTVTALGPELRLAGKVVVGQWWPEAQLDALAIAGGQGDADGQLSYAAAVREGVWGSTLPAVMNPGGRGNASSARWKLIGQSPEGYAPGEATNRCKVFTAPGRTVGSAAAEAWTVYSALRSVVEWIDDGRILSSRATDWMSIEALLGDVPLGTVDLTGMSLVEAMRAILMPVGFSFAVEPWQGPDGCHRLIVFRRHNPAPAAPVFMPGLGGQPVSIASAQGQRAQVQRVRFQRDARDVHNRVIVVGDVKLTQQTLTFDQSQATRDLHPYWDTSTYDLDDYDDSNLIGPGRIAGDSKLAEWLQRYEAPAAQYRHVFRTFAWNEDAALSDVIPKVPDLSVYGPEGTASCVAHRPRPIGPRLEFADADTTEGALKAPLIEIGIAQYTGGEFVVDSHSWIPLPAGQAVVRPDRAAVTLVEPELLSWRPWADVATLSGSKTLHELYGHLTYPTLLHNTLRAATDGSCLLNLRVTGTLEMDDRVSVEARGEIDAGWPLESLRVVRMGSRFRYRAEGTTVSESLAATVDDSSGADGPMNLLARRLRDTGQDARGCGAIHLRGLCRIYRPGMGLGRIAGRNVDLTVRPGGGPGAAVVPSIVEVVWDFQEGGHRTALFLDTPKGHLP